MALTILETNVVLDLYDHDGTRPQIKSIALDDNTRYVFARLTYKGQTYDIGSDATVKLIIIRPDKVGAQVIGETKVYENYNEDETVSNVYGAYAELDQPAIAVAGTLLGQFIITSGDQILRSQIFAVNNGQALDADEWAGQYDGYNLDELVQTVNDSNAKVDAMEADVSELKSGFTNIKATIYEKQSTVLHEAGQYAYSNGLNNAYVWLYKTPIPKKAEFSITIYGRNEQRVGAVTVYFLAQNPDETFSVVDSADITTVVGENIVPIPQGLTDEHDIFIGFYSVNNGVAYNSSGARVLPTTRFSYSSPLPEKITATGSFNMDFNANIEYSTFEDYIADLQSRVSALESAEMVTVDANGTGKYTTIIDAINAEAENTVICVKPGIYNQDMTACLKKRIILIGTDRNSCIIRDTDGRYGHHPLYISCGYFENLTIEAPYISGTSQEVGVSDLGAYAVHIDTDDDYGVGKTTEFHHCTIKSDFFPAVGLGMRKDATYIFDDCELINGQITGRGDYSDEGTLGALYFHDSNGTQGDQYIKIKDCVLKSNLAYAMCPYMVNRTPQNNRVYCDFVNNVLYSSTGKYANTVWFRRDPFNVSTGIFRIGIGYGNSIATLNN